MDYELCNTVYMMINSLTECCIMRHDVKLVTRCIHHKGFPGGSVVKNPPANAEDAGFIPGLGRSPGEENGNPRQYSCLEIPWTEEPGGLQSMGSQRVRHD